MFWLIKVIRYLIYAIGGFFIVMSLDTFSMESHTFFEQLLGFLINSLPGIGLILVNYFLRKKELIKGTILIVLAVFLFFFFDMYENFPESIYVILIVFVPLLSSGIIFCMTKNQYDKD